MVQRAAIDSPSNKNALTQTQVEQKNQDDQGRDRMAGESPAYQRSNGNQRVPRLISHVKGMEARPSGFPFMIGLMVVGTLIYLSSKKSVN
jgi:hypothetical protein